MDSRKSDTILAVLNHFRVEIPSWGFANTGTRFGKFSQPAAATSAEEKFSDAGQVHALTGICPTVALHVLWDFLTESRASHRSRAFPSASVCNVGPSTPICSRIRNISSAHLAIPTFLCARGRFNIRRKASTPPSIFAAATFRSGLRTVQATQEPLILGSERHGSRIY